ncbi:hypothetical protein N0V91_004915 [Didymella pomorum]|uniref:BTB domain-containing protein n=1 Tax=Didymella pomorum TaxID=749634 RepID=A0A9W8ZDY6_9PLEO|nr:hypothetical protein N0V91_004915 [Didymella pomorum]
MTDSEATRPKRVREWNEGKYPEGPEDGGDNTYLRDQWYITAQLVMLKAYAFAHRTLCAKFTDALEHNIVDAYITGDTSPPWHEAVIYAFGHLPSGSSVLKIVIDTHCHHFDENYDREDNGQLQFRAQLPNTFLTGVMDRLAKLNGDQQAKVDDCRCIDTNDRYVELDRTAARNGIITILVGTDCVKYGVRRAILTQHSQYFKKALEVPWKEAEEGLLQLEDVEPETFGPFVD